MIIFNMTSIIELVVAGLIAAAIAGILYLFGLSFSWWLVVVTLSLVIPLDGLWRFGQVIGNDEEEEEGSGGGIAQLVLPSGGGHLFFLPMWLIGGMGVIAVTAYGWGV